MPEKDNTLNLEKVFPEIEFKRYLLETHLKFNQEISELHRFIKLRNSNAPIQLMKTVKLSMELYLALKPRIQKDPKKKFSRIVEIMDKYLKDDGEDISSITLKELINLGLGYSDFFLETGITKLGFDGKDPGFSFLNS